MAGEVVTTGTRTADAARVDARQGTALDAEPAEAAVAAGVPGPDALNGDSEAPQATEDAAAPASRSRLPPHGRRGPPASVPTGLSGPERRPRRAAGDAAAPGVGVRRRLARLGAQRGAGINPVLEPLIKTVRGTHPKADIRLIERAYESAAYWHRDQKRRSGDPYITHPLAVATILAELGMNTETICAALLHDTVEDTPYTLTELRGEFGEDVAALVDGVTKLDKVKYGESAEAETVRKMVVAMSRDIRVLVIKLADRLHNMRTLRYLPREKQERKSREVLEIFAPLAHRLGMTKVKWELEDLAFATLYPKRFDEIVRLVSARAPRREAFLQEVIQDVSARPARGQDQPEGHRPSQALLLDLPEDDREGSRLRRHLRPGGHPRPRRFGQGLLRGARHHPRAVESRPRAVQGLHRDAEVQHVPVAAYHGDRAGRQGGGAADPDLGHAPPGGVRRRGALEVQGRDGLRPVQGRQGRGPGNGLAQAACRLAARDRGPGRVP